MGAFGDLLFFFFDLSGLDQTLAGVLVDQRLEVVRVDAERNLVLIKGAVPGAKSGDVIIRPAVKQ